MRYVFCLALLFLSACASSMSGREFVNANQVCEQANAVFEAQVECLNDFLLTRNMESGDYDVYYSWVKERRAIMELYRKGELDRTKAQLALLDAQQQYQNQLLSRDLRDIAAWDAMERRRPHHCYSYPAGEGRTHTSCY